jgi:hypothetical protein
MSVFGLLLTVLARVRVRLRLARCRDFWFLPGLVVFMRHMVFPIPIHFRKKSAQTLHSPSHGANHSGKSLLRSQDPLAAQLLDTLLHARLCFPALPSHEHIPALFVFWTLAPFVTWLHSLEAQPRRHHLILLLQWGLELVESSVHSPQLHRRRP